MEIMMEHSELPWHGYYETDNNDNPIIEYIGVQKDHKEICQFFNKLEDQFENSNANAEFIIRSVNNHYQLVEALKASTAWLYLLIEEIGIETNTCLSVSIGGKVIESSIGQCLAKCSVALDKSQKIELPQY